VTARDRIVLIVVGFAALLAAFWFLAISPKRKETTDVTAQVTAAHQRLETAQASASNAEAARKRYATDYATVARLGKAVPVDDDVPSLVYQLESTAHHNSIDFRSIKLSASPSAAATPAANAANAVAAANGNTAGASSTTPASAAPAALPPGAAVGAAGFPTMPFTFDFQGSYFGMQRFLRAIDDLIDVKGEQVSVKGRLLSVDGFQLKAGPEGFPKVDATVAATAYLLPADEGLTAGASPTAPGSGSGTQTASTSGTAPTPSASLIGSDR
jgi:type II secretory pathway pseudopilin PulG